MLWASAWRQTPCGSLPDDDALIAVRIGMKASVFSKHKAMLMRGWWKANDGRLYHETIAVRVTEMLALRDKERNRKAEYRKRKDAEEGSSPGVVPSESRGTNEGQLKDSGGKDNTSTSTSTSTNTNNKEPPIPPDGGLPEIVQAKTKKRSAIAFQTFLEDCKANDELSIPENDSVFTYAQEAGLPIEFLRLHWLEFKERYTAPDAKRYKDWRSVYRKSVRGCWFKLWFIRADGTCGLTTQGEQAKRFHGREDQ